MNLRSQLIEFEGWKNRAYPDPLTGGEPYTIGVGHTGPEVHLGLEWTDAQIGAQLDTDIEAKTLDCRDAFPWLDSLNEPRQAVIIGMAFQLGLRGLQKFVNMLGYVADQRWPQAAGEMRASQWARQTPKRAMRLSHQMEIGEWT